MWCFLDEAYLRELVYEICDRRRPMKNGNRRSKYNATKHGILANILLADDHMGEWGKKYRLMLSALQKSIRPVDSYEKLLVEKLTFLHVRLALIYKADWRLAPKLFEKLEKSIDAEHPFVVNREVYDFVEVMGQRKDPTPELLIRYESNTERQIRGTLDQIKQWRMMRPNDSKPPAELEEQTANQEGKEALAETTIPSPATEDDV
jgi:hypothetical protein